MKVMIFSLFLILSIHVASEETWVNWIGNQHSCPKDYFEPVTLQELRRCIMEGAAKGYSIRAAGSGYSISEIGCTDGRLVSLKQLNHILAIDLENKCVRVEAGITLQELNDELARHALALPNQPAVATITLGGALSTAVHGTGHTGTLSSFIKNIELITADGIVHDLSLQSDPEAFGAVKVSLGALGIIYAFTLQCEALFDVKVDHYCIEIDELITHYQELHRDNDFFQFSWNAQSGKAMVRSWNRSHPEDLLQPEFTPSYKALAWYTPDPSDKDLFSESAIPMECLPEALIKIKGLIDKYSKLGASIADVDIRFVDADDHSYLSPAAGRPTAYIAMSISHQDKYLTFYQEFEELMFSYLGRPHWGKVNFLTFEKAQKLYGSNLAKFIKVKQRLDPHGVFSNAYTDRFLLTKKKEI